MQTLQNILDGGNSAFQQGAPYVPNWAQAKACFQMFGSVVNLNDIPIDEFEQIFPEGYDDAGDIIKNGIPSKRTYQNGRREILKVLQARAYLGDPWDVLHSLLKAHSRNSEANRLCYISTPASKDGLTPAAINSQWALAHDRDLGGGSRRNSFRAGVRVFNTLFTIPPIATSGLLPQMPICALPVYDKCGRPQIPLPSSLVEHIDRDGHLRWVWHAISVSDTLDLPERPTPSDLLNAWSDIQCIDPGCIGFTERTWKRFLCSVLRVLNDHEGIQPAPLPPALVAVEADVGPKEKVTIRAFGRKILSFGEADLERAEIRDLMEPKTWQRIWQEAPLQFSEGTERQYAYLTRKALMALDETLPDPMHNQPYLPSFLTNVADGASERAQLGLQAFWRKIVLLEEEALLAAPVEDLLEPDTWNRIWKDSPLKLAETTEQEYEAAAKKALVAAYNPDPVTIAWDEFYAVITENTLLTEAYPNLWYIRAEAIKALLSPNEITQEWLEQMRDTCPRDRLSQLYGGVKELGEISGFEHISPLRTRRQRHDGLPQTLADELNTFLQKMGFAPTNQRQTILAVGVLFNRLGADETICLEELLNVDLDKVDWNCPDSQQKTYADRIAVIKRYLSLPWTPDWDALQAIVVNNGVGLKANPIPKILSHNPGSTPKLVTLEWAQNLDRRLRSTIFNPPHGRASVAKRLATHLATFDELHEIPEIASSGLMPDRIGSIR